VRQRGDRRLGAVLRQMRTARQLTLAAAARRVGCAESLLSQVETGHRGLQPWLATALDLVYDTGGAITALTGATGAVPASGDNEGRGDADVVLVLIPGRGISVPVSRRELLAALGIGALGGSLLPALQRACAAVVPDEEVLAELEQTLSGLKAAGRIMPPGRLVGPLTAQVALIEALRRRAPDPLGDRYTRLQARYAESLSWMAEEAGDLTAALYWTDRAEHWAQISGWRSMACYAHVRRSMLAISYAGDGLAAVEQAKLALRVPGAPARVLAMACKQVAYGYALAGQPDPSRYALDHTAALFEQAHADEPEAHMPGQNSVDDADLLAIFEATCEVYLGAGHRVIHALEPRMTSIGSGSRRTSAITAAKLAQAYAHAGEPALACGLILATVDTAASVDSLTTRSELRRALPTLDRWPGRDDVREVRHRLAA
jgi:Helix-turn-helix domain